MERDAARTRPSLLDRLTTTRWAPLFAFSLLTLVLGYWLKARCLDVPWGGGAEFRHFCYNDLRPLYFSNGFAAGGIPYVTAQHEYPALTGAISWVIAKMFEGDVRNWWHGNAVLLFLAGLGVTYYLYREGHDWRTATPWVLAPSIVIDGFTNWDLWAVFFLVAGLVLFREGRLLWAGVAIGLGTAAKLFPAVAGPAMVLVLVNRARRNPLGLRDPALPRQLARLAGGFLVGWVPVNLAFILKNAAGWWRTYEFHTERGTSFQTIYYFWDQFVGRPYFGYGMTTEDFNRASLVLLVVTVTVLLAYAWRRRSEDVFLLTTGLLALHILTGKFYSPQYALWLLPLFVLARLPIGLYWTFAVAHVVSFIWAYHLRLPPAGTFEGMSWDVLGLFNAASFVLLVTIAVIVGVVWERLKHPTAATVPQGTASAPSPADVAPAK